MSDETTEYENVRIGNWQIRLPSQICTDSNIFQEIFSSNTWNTLFTPEQRSRISEMLPKEVQSKPGEVWKTMDELFSGTLTRFGTNPLESFFSQLDAGHFDPGVVETKNEIKKVWRKEALRRRKKYHTKLLQELVLSRESHLKKFNASGLTETPTQETFVIKTEHQRLMPAEIAPDNCNHKITTPAPINKTQKVIVKQQPQRIFPPENMPVIPKHVAKRIHDEVNSVNNSFRNANCPEDGSPMSKKPTLTSLAAPNKILKPKTKMAKILITKLDPQLTTFHGPVVVPETAASHLTSSKSGTIPIAPSPTTNISTSVTSLNNFVRVNTPIQNSLKEPPATTAVVTHLIAAAPKTREEQAAAQMAKFPKILPAPATSTTGTSSPKLLTGTSTLRNHQIKTSKLGIALMNPYSNLSTNASKSSPILASQLQAPVISLMNRNNVGRTTGITDNNKQVSMLPPSSYVNMDDMDSSSDDEFEAIEPTIGFAPNLVFQKSTQPSKNSSTFSRGNNFSARSTVKSTVSNSQAKLKLTTPIMTNKISNLVTSQSQKIVASSPVVLTPSTKIPTTGNISVIPTYSPASTTTMPVTPISTMLSSAPNAQSTPIPVVSCSNFSTKQLLVSSGSATPKLLPISIANIQNLNSFNKVQKIQSYFSFTNATTAPTVTTTTLNNGPSASLAPAEASTPIVIKSAKVVPSVSSCTSSNAESGVVALTSASTSAVASPLALSLSDLSLNLNLGLSLDSSVDTKLMQDIDDKMDDLSVLDGNPFDSIPNLSDELDGFDLDLVDGLCDFDVLLSEEKQYASFFSLIRDVLCSTRDHRMTLVCLERTVRKWALSPIAALNLWFLRINDWNDALITALNFLAGNYQGSFHVHPEDFVPYIEYKYKTKYYQWIGAGRDNDNNLLPLCNMWLDNLDRLPPLKKQDGDNEDQEEDDDENEDSDGPGEEVKKKSKRPQTPPPPRCVTDWTVRPSTLEEKEVFQQQERIRFENPHKAFTYQMHCYESVVGPVKGVYSSQSGMTNKARGHSLLVDDRPPYVTILALVRDAVARLPNGEGTRSEICEMLRDSAFLAAEASNVTLNSVVSGALDRLHYERDPCVRYDSHKKSWIYLHRDRTQEQFERLHHNRSYTKSTKSRSNTSRKSRKQSKSVSQTPVAPVVGQSGSSVTSTATATYVTSTSTSNTNTNNPPPLQPIPTTSELSTSVSSSATIVIPQSTAAFKSKLPPVGSIVMKSINIPVSVAQQQKFNLLNPDIKPDIKPVITDISLRIHPQGSNQLKEILTLPPKQLISSTSSPLKDILSAALVAPAVPRLQYRNSGLTTTSVLGKGWGQTSDILNTSNISTGTSQSPTQGIQLQIQNLATSAIVSGTTTTSTTSTTLASNIVNHLISNPAVSVASSPSLQPNPTLGQGQFILNPNTLLKFTNNVRFTHVRLPFQQNGPGSAQNPNQLRLPQHRLVLTRGAFTGLSSNAQTQGLLLGQTQTGQTIFLSAGNFGNLPASTQAQLTPFTVSTQMQQRMPDTRNIMNHIQTTLSQANPTINLTLSSPTTNQPQPSTNLVTSMNAVRANSTPTLSTSVQPGHNMGTRLVTVVCTAAITSTINSNNVVTSTTKLGANSTNVNVNSLQSKVQQPQRIQQNHPAITQLTPRFTTHNVLPSSLAHIPNQSQSDSVPTTETQSLTQTLTQAHTATTTHPQLTSPIIIRSNQGDFVIPAHISLGMQGIKVIPVPSGKQTLLARLVAPGGPMTMMTSAVPPPSSTPTQTTTEQL